MKTIIYLFLVSILFNGCAHKPTAEEIRAKEVYEQHIADSIKEHYALVKAERDSLTIRVIQIKGDLEAAEQRLNDAKGFKFLRTASEKENEISVLKQNVEILKINLQSTEERLRSIN